jgi:signal transduction histidine kinase
MSFTADYQFRVYAAGRNTSVDIIQYALENISREIPFDFACVCTYSASANLVEPLADLSNDTPPAVKSGIYRMLQEAAGDFKPDSDPILLTSTDFYKSDFGFNSGLIIPLATPDQVIGVLGLFAALPNQYAPKHLQQVSVFENITRVVLENHHLYRRLADNLVISQSILETAQAIAENPSTQNVINILHDYLFDTHITSSAILLYGPTREDRPSGPFDYLEVKGTWSRRHGSGVAVGTKFALKKYPDLLRELDEQKIVTIPSTAKLKFDPFVRALLRVERVRSMTLLALHTTNRKLGIIFVGTDRRHHFTASEIRSYQTVSEFLAISAMAQTLQHQHDFVQQGRAALLDAVHDGVLMVLPDMNGARVLTINQRFAKILGIAETEAQGLLLRELLQRISLPEDVRQHLRDSWLKLPSTDPGTQNGEFRLIHAEGTPMDIQWYSAPVYLGGHVLGRIYILHDVSPERAAVRVRSAFLSRVSHELRTPLTSIQGFADFILEVSGDQLPDIAREYTEIIFNSAKHLNRVFTDMIEITRADAGEMRLNLGKAHLPDIIIDVVARLELHYKKREQSVIMDLDDDLPPVSIDTDRIMQVLTNLVNNAIKYSPAGGKIYVSTHYIDTPDALPEGAPSGVVIPSILVTVMDEGAGIDKNDLERIFMPFFRTESARVQKIEGAGLGLAVSRSIIELHRGRIWAGRQPERGGVFMFTLPISKE